MQARWKTVIILLLLAGISAWLLNKLSAGRSASVTQPRHNPDYTMENFTTLTMNQDGSPKNRLTAEYMAHYPDDDTTELIKPRLQLYRTGKQPVMVSADKGWVTQDNEVILLTGDVRLREDNADGGKRFEIITSAVRILASQEYAETDKPAELIGERTNITATGVRAYLKENRLELLNNVHTTIQPKPAE